MIRQETALIYSPDDEVVRVFSGVFSELGFQTDVSSAGVREAAEAAAGWTFAPDFLVLDLSQSSDMLEDLEYLAHHSPEADTDVIVVGPRGDISIYRQLRALGVCEYFDPPFEGGEIISVLSALVDQRRERNRNLDPKKAIACVSAHGGAGASTVAHGMAWMAAESGLRTLLVDLDVRSAMQYVFVSPEGSSGFLDTLRSPDRVDQTFLERMVLRPAPNLTILSEMAEQPGTGRGFSDKGLEAVLATVRSDVDLVVFDLPRAPEVGSALLNSCHRLVIAAEANVIGLRNSRVLYQNLQVMSARKVLLAVNKSGQARETRLSGDQFSSRLGEPAVELPYDIKAVQGSLFNGESFMNTNSALAKAIHRQMTEFTLGAHKRSEKSVFQKLLGL